MGTADLVITTHSRPKGKFNTFHVSMLMENL